MDVDDDELVATSEVEDELLEDDELDAAPLVVELDERGGRVVVVGFAVVAGASTVTEPCMLGCTAQV